MGAGFGAPAPMGGGMMGGGFGAPMGAGGGFGAPAPMGGGMGGGMGRGAAMGGGAYGGGAPAGTFGGFGGQPQFPPQQPMGGSPFGAAPPPNNGPSITSNEYNPFDGF